jgi:hypothetical protein
MNHRHGQFVGLLDLHAGAEIGDEHGQAFINQFLDRALRQRGSGLELVDHDALDPQFGVVVGLNFLDAL